jgi:hypothetical protein
MGHVGMGAWLASYSDLEQTSPVSIRVDQLSDLFQQFRRNRCVSVIKTGRYSPDSVLKHPPAIVKQ